MTVFYQIDPQAGIIYSELTGSVTDDELCHATEKLWSDPVYCPGYSSLVDLSQADFNHITPDSVRRIGIHNRMAHVGRVALVATNTVAYGMAHMYQAYMDGVESDIFDDRSAALDWIQTGKRAEAASGG